MVGKLGKNAAVAAGSRHYACLFMPPPVDVPKLNPAERHRVSGANCRSARLDPLSLDRSLLPFRDSAVAWIRHKRPHDFMNSNCQPYVGSRNKSVSAVKAHFERKTPLGSGVL